MYAISDHVFKNITHLVKKNHAAKYDPGKLIYLSERTFIEYLARYIYTDTIINIDYYYDHYIHQEFLKKESVYNIIYPKNTPDLIVFSRLIFYTDEL